MESPGDEHCVADFVAMGQVTGVISDHERRVEIAGRISQGS